MVGVKGKGVYVCGGGRDGGGGGVLESGVFRVQFGHNVFGGKQQLCEAAGPWTIVCFSQQT